MHILVSFIRNLTTDEIIGFFIGNYRYPEFFICNKKYYIELVVSDCINMTIDNGNVFKSLKKYTLFDIFREHTSREENIAKKLVCIINNFSLK